SATTDIREPWFAAKTKRWPDRYGGNWPLVHELIAASVKARNRRELLTKVGLSALSALAVVAVAGAAVYSWIASHEVKIKSLEITSLRGDVRELKKATDEAQSAGREAATFPQADEDYFHDMDHGVSLSPEEIRGRNMWLVWTGGNDRFWDKIT